MTSGTDDINAVGGRVLVEIAKHMSMFQPLGYDAQLDPSHLDPHNWHDIVVMWDLFGDGYFFAELLEITSDTDGLHTHKDDHTFLN